MQDKNDLPEIRLSNQLHAQVMGQAARMDSTVTVGLWLGSFVQERMEVGITDQREDVTEESKKVILLQHFIPLPSQPEFQPASSSKCLNNLLPSLNGLAGFVRFRKGPHPSSTPSLQDRKLAFRFLSHLSSIKQEAADLDDNEVSLIFTMVHSNYNENRLQANVTHHLVTMGYFDNDERRLPYFNFRKLPATVLNLGRQRRLPYDTTVRPSAVGNDPGLSEQLQQLWFGPSPQYNNLIGFCQYFKKEKLNHVLGQLCRRQSCVPNSPQGQNNHPKQEQPQRLASTGDEDLEDEDL